MILSLCRLFERLSNLLDVQQAIPYVAEVMIEVFRGAPKLCLKIEESTVEKIIHLLPQTQHSGQLKLIMSLQMIAKVDSLKHIYHTSINIIIDHH